jgi:hypothetical protein
LQGIWTNATITPFERAATLADKQFLTPEEVAALEKEAAANRVDAPPKEGDVGAYNQVWFDSGTKVVSSRQTSLVVDPPDGRVPVKPSAEAKRDYDLAHSADSWEYMSVWDRCITRGVPAGMFPAGYNNAYQIAQIPGYVVLLYEMIHEARIIPVDGSPHLSQTIRQWNGDSRGHWEGNTLVVETTNLTDRTSIGANGNGLRHSAEMKLIERFTRTEADVIRYEVTMEDPKTYARPWKISLPLTSPSGFYLLPYECHEGNHAIFNSLSAERAEDQALADDARKGVIRSRRPVQGLSFSQTVGDDSALVPLLQEDGPPPASSPSR